MAGFTQSHNSFFVLQNFVEHKFAKFAIIKKFDL